MNVNELRAKTDALLAALKLRDEGTHDHSVRVARVSLLLGRELGLERIDLFALYQGAKLHDIGKIATREAILLKPGPHTHIECLHMREHARVGAEMLTELQFPISIVQAVAQHHERWDGLGYPAGLKGAGISRLARVIAVADAFDAITNNRCYRNGRSYQAAAAALTKGTATQFDPDVVQAFFRISEESFYASQSQ